MEHLLGFGEAAERHAADDTSCFLGSGPAMHVRSSAARRIRTCSIHAGSFLRPTSGLAPRASSSTSVPLTSPPTPSSAFFLPLRPQLPLFPRFAATRMSFATMRGFSSWSPGRAVGHKTRWLWTHQRRSVQPDNNGGAVPSSSSPPPWLRLRSDSPGSTPSPPKLEGSPVRRAVKVVLLTFTYGPLLYVTHLLLPTGLHMVRLFIYLFIYLFFIFILLFILYYGVS